MDYKDNTNEYIIDNSNWDEEIEDSEFQEEMKTASMKNSELPEGMEIIDTTNHSVDVNKEIQEAAEKEGLDTGDPYLGGKGATPEAVVEALTTEAMPEGAQKAKEEYEEKKTSNLKKIVATRDILFSRFNKLIDIPIKFTDPESGEEVQLVFKMKRLSEAENNHLLNHELIGKKISDLTEDEYQESIKFKRNVLASTVVEPKLTADEWAYQVDNAMASEIFDKVQQALIEVNDAEIFQ